MTATKKHAARPLGDVADAEYLGGTQIRFTHRRCGHVWTQDYSKGPAHRRMGPSGCKLMAHWWSHTNKGVISHCPKCTRDAAKAARAAPAAPPAPRPQPGPAAPSPDSPRGRLDARLRQVRAAQRRQAKGLPAKP